MQLEVIKSHPDALIPKYAHLSDSGLDLYSIEEAYIQPNETISIRTGIRINLPVGTEAQIRPRSGLAFKKSITILNTPGTIDQGFTGEIVILMINHGKEKFLIEKHMRIAQMVIAPIIKVNITEVASFPNKDRNEKGFGSTGLY
ncbi:dUTP diphosphatase [Sutcliffiella horikoshii]|uniref:dUTP diphosphatase n=1 Tax=Sutcliffiella horikoshii TaxID=79883 RepID=UPI00384FCFC2